jgi:hypothetical protein
MRFFLSQGKHTAGILKEVQYDRMQNHRDGFEENEWWFRWDWSTVDWIIDESG